MKTYFHKNGRIRNQNIIRRVKEEVHLDNNTGSGYEKSLK